MNRKHKYVSRHTSAPINIFSINTSLENSKVKKGC